MPYIKIDRRMALAAGAEPECAGELNYVLTCILLADQVNRGLGNLDIVKRIAAYQRTKGVCYQTFNDILGALEGCRFEFKRRLSLSEDDQRLTHLSRTAAIFYGEVVAKYEDKKCAENGDVFGPYLEKRRIFKDQQ